MSRTFLRALSATTPIFLHTPVALAIMAPAALFFAARARMQNRIQWQAKTTRDLYAWASRAA